MGFRAGVDPPCELQLLICDLGHVILDWSRGYEICIHDISICVSDHKEVIYLFNVSHTQQHYNFYFTGD